LKAKLLDSANGQIAEENFGHLRRLHCRPALTFLDEETPAALRDALNDAIRKAQILLGQVDARWPVMRIPGKC
jgi:hypothetical protein